MATQPARKQQLVAALAGLLDDTQARSVQGRIREIYDDIMDLKKAGVKNKAIIERLNSQPEFLNNQLTSPVFAAYLGKIKLAKIREAKEAAGLVGITELATVRASATSNTAQKPSGNKATTNANNSSAPPEMGAIGNNANTSAADSDSVVQQTAEVGFVDIFQKQAEREKEKLENPAKFRRTPRR